MSLVLAQDLSLSFGPKTLFEDASFSIGPTDRIGLVGANGTGKSSLLKILAGTVHADEGTLRFRRNARLGYLPQEIAAPAEGTLLESVLRAVPGRDELDGEIAGVEEAIGQETDEAEQLALAQQLADLHEARDHFEERFGKHRAERILVGLGFKERDFGRTVAELSGGWRMRGALAGLLLQDPDLLLLDEPTNHLDVPTLTWFDDFLRRSNKALVLISHDRDFLNRQISRVISLEVEGLRSYAGSYDHYKVQRREEIEQLKARAERVEARKAELEAFIERFGAKASKARQAQSRAKMLEKLETVEVFQERDKVRFRFPDAPRSGRDVARLSGIEKRYGETVVYRGLSATIERGQRIAVVGANGAGKTTLLKLLAGEAQADGGTVEIGQNVILGYYAQHHADTLDKKDSVFESVRKVAQDRSPNEVRSTLGAFLFSGDDVEKPIGVLSGGERARVALARLLLVPANFMLMDEPTNHLDLDSTEALIDALKGYGGTLLFVSHNRSFVNQLATHVWDVHDGTVTSHPGNLDDFLHHQALTQAAPAEAGPVAQGDGKISDKERRRLEAEARQRKSAREGPVRKELASVEAEIQSLEAEQQKSEAMLSDPALYNDFARAKPLMDEHRGRGERIAALYARWEELQLKLEELAAQTN
jgi:ATP-binding cassette subfamily F protein 3